MDLRHLDSVIGQTVQRIVAHQQPDGSFGYWCEATPISEAVMVIFLHLIGQPNHPVISPLCASIVRRQSSDGGWALYPTQSSDLSLTTLSYFALLLAGESKHALRMRDAGRTIVGLGGITETSTFAKVLLATAGQLPWGIITTPPLSLISFDPFGPINLFDVTAPARIHLPSILILSHRRYTVSIAQSASLTHLIDPKRDTVEKAPIPYPNPSAMAACRKFLLDRMEDDGTWAGYLSATVMGALALQALGHAADKPLIQKSIDGLMRLLVTGPSRDAVTPSIHQQFFPSTVWDTSLSMQALMAAGMSPRHPVLQRAASYLIAKQHARLSDWQYHAPDVSPGGWAFSGNNTRYPDIDDTVSALQALNPYRRHGVWTNEWNRGLTWLLALQNDDGGWSPFDRNCNKPYLMLFAPDDLKDSILDPSTPDITARVLHLLGATRVWQMDGRFAKTPHNLRFAETVKASGIDTAVSRARNWVLNQQRADGSWYGRWGITYIYGTWAAIRGLRSTGVSRSHPAIQRARTWLLGIQNPDGGFGESCRSDEEKTYIPLGSSTASQTAWAVMGLCASSDGGIGETAAAIRRAVGYLARTARIEGGWRENFPTGSGVTGQVYLRYHSYPVIWPLMALCTVRRKFGGR